MAHMLVFEGAFSTYEKAFKDFKQMYCKSILAVQKWQTMILYLRENRLECAGILTALIQEVQRTVLSIIH